MIGEEYTYVRLDLPRPGALVHAAHAHVDVPGNRRQTHGGVQLQYELCFTVLFLHSKIGIYSPVLHIQDDDLFITDMRYTIHEVVHVTWTTQL